MARKFRPEAYDSGKIAFAGLLLQVDERVYLPNPETGLLAELVSEAMDDLTASNKTLIDVGTGSGNLATWLGLKHRPWKILATDISKDALTVAAENFKGYHLNNVTAIHTDLVQDITDAPAIIICNLPWGTEEYMLRSNTAELLSAMPEISVYPQGGIIGAYLNLCAQVAEKKWRSTIFAEVGRIPEAAIAAEIKDRYRWTYRQITADYGVLIIHF